MRQHTINVTLLIVILTATYALPSQAQETVAISGELKTWHKITLSFTGPYAAEQLDTGRKNRNLVTTTANPFLDFRLQVKFTSPSNRVYNVPGFFNGDANGNG